VAVYGFGRLPQLVVFEDFYLIRLMRMGLEVLQTGELRVRRVTPSNFPQLATGH
jgi:hypothetical protein